MSICHSRNADAISSMIGCSIPDTVSSAERKEGRGGSGLFWFSFACDSVGVGDTDRRLAGYTGSLARMEFAWSGGGVSLKEDLRGAILWASVRSSRSSSVREISV